MGSVWSSVGRDCFTLGRRFVFRRHRSSWLIRFGLHVWACRFICGPKQWFSIELVGEARQSLSLSRAELEERGQKWVIKLVLAHRLHIIFDCARAPNCSHAVQSSTVQWAHRSLLDVLRAERSRPEETGGGRVTVPLLFLSSSGANDGDMATERERRAAFAAN